MFLGHEEAEYVGLEWFVREATCPRSELDEVGMTLALDGLDDVGVDCADDVSSALFPDLDTPVEVLPEHYRSFVVQDAFDRGLISEDTLQYWSGRQAEGTLGLDERVQRFCRAGNAWIKEFYADAHAHREVLAGAMALQVKDLHLHSVGCGETQFVVDDSLYRVYSPGAAAEAAKRNLQMIYRMFAAKLDEMSSLESTFGDAYSPMREQVEEQTRAVLTGDPQIIDALIEKEGMVNLLLEGVFEDGALFELSSGHTVLRLFGDFGKPYED